MRRTLEETKERIARTKAKQEKEMVFPDPEEVPLKS